VVFQHETDHLNGTLFIDKIAENKISFMEEFLEFKLGEKENLLEE
jgi:peptide deformylase